MGGGFVVPDGEEIVVDEPSAPTGGGFVVPDEAYTPKPPSAISLFSDSPALDQIATPQGRPPADAMQGMVADELVNLTEGGGPLLGAAGLRSLAGLGLKFTPLGKVPFASPVVKGISTLLGATLGDQAGEVAGDAIKQYAKENKPLGEIEVKLPTDEQFVQDLPRHAVEGMAAVTIDKVFNKIFGAPGKTAAKMRNSAADNYLSVLGLTPKDAKFVMIDDVGEQVVSDLAPDVLAVKGDGLFEKAKINLNAIQYNVKKASAKLKETVENALSMVNREEKKVDPNFDQKVGDAAIRRLDDLKAWASQSYVDTPLEEEAHALIDTAIDSVLNLAEKDRLDLVTLNRLKQNYYSDKAKYVNGVASASQVTNTTEKRIAAALKEAVEEVYGGSKFKGDVKDIGKTNDLWSSYLTVDKIVEGSAARGRITKPQGLSAIANQSMAAGGLAFAATQPAELGIPAAVAALPFANNALKYPAAQRMLAETKLPISSLFQQASDAGGAAPALGGLSSGLFNLGARPELSDKVQDATTRAMDAMVPSAHADEVYLPRDTNGLLNLDTHEYPAELLDNQDFQILLEQQKGTPRNKAQALSDFLKNNPELARTYFEDSPYSGYTVVGRDGNNYILDPHEQIAFAQDLRAKYSGDQNALTEKLNALNNPDDPGRILDHGDISFFKTDALGQTIQYRGKYDTKDRIPGPDGTLFPYSNSEGRGSYSKPKAKKMKTTNVAAGVKRQNPDY